MCLLCTFCGKPFALKMPNVWPNWVLPTLYVTDKHTQTSCSWQFSFHFHDKGSTQSDARHPTAVGNGKNSICWKYFNVWPSAGTYGKLGPDPLFHWFGGVEGMIWWIYYFKMKKESDGEKVSEKKDSMEERQLWLLSSKGDATFPTHQPQQHRNPNLCLINPQSNNQLPQGDKREGGATSAQYECIVKETQCSFVCLKIANQFVVLFYD